MIDRIGFWSFILTCSVILLVRRQSSISDDSLSSAVNRNRRDVGDSVNELDLSGRIEFDELYDGTYSYNRFSATWSKIHPEFYFKSDSTTSPSIWRQQFNFAHFAATGENIKGDKVKLVSTNWKQYCDGDCTTYYVSPNEKFILFQKTNKQLWRRSYQKQFYLFDVATEKVLPTFFDEFNPTSNCLYAGWSPTGAKLAAVCGFNLFYLNVDEDSTAVKKITEDGDEFKQLHGVCDWANEEENIKADNTIYWSPDSSSLLFASYDLTEVELLEYNTYQYGSWRMESMEDRYPEVRRIKYAKAGTKPAPVTMTVFNTEEGKTEEVEMTGSNVSEMVHVSRVSWNGAWFIMEWINRDTTKTAGYICSKSTKWACSESTSTVQTSPAWVGFKGPFYPTALAEQGVFYTIRTRPIGGDSYWQMVKIDSNKDEITFIPSEEKPVVASGTKIMKTSNDESTIFYEYAAPDPNKRNLYTSVIDSSDGTSVEKCLTCELDNEFDPVTNMNSCWWKSFVFQRQSTDEDESYSLFVNCRGPGVPKTLVTQFTINDQFLETADKLEFLTYDDNKNLQEKVLSKSENWITREYATHQSVNYTDKPYNYELFYSKSIDKTADKKYALLVFVYGAPEYQNVDSVWTTDFVKAYLPSSYNVVTLLIDGRGSAYEGDKFMHQTYKKLGYIEPFDQIEVTRQVVQDNKFIDPERVGIYGWSYG